MKTKKVQSEEVKKDVSCDKCEGSNCVAGYCTYGNCPGGICYGRPCKSWGWKIFSVIFRTILMLLILCIVFALGAAIGGAGVLGYVNNGDFSYGPGMMMRGDGSAGSWAYKTGKLMGDRTGFQMMMGYESLDAVKQNSAVRIFGNIVEVRSGELTIADNSGKNVDVISGSFTIIETSKGEIGIQDLRVDEGVTVYGMLIDSGVIKAGNIRVSR